MWTKYFALPPRPRQDPPQTRRRAPPIGSPPLRPRPLHLYRRPRAGARERSQQENASPRWRWSPDSSEAVRSAAQTETKFMSLAQPQQQPESRTVSMLDSKIDMHTHQPRPSTLRSVGCTSRPKEQGDRAETSLPAQVQHSIPHSAQVWTGHIDDLNAQNRTKSDSLRSQRCARTWHSVSEHLSTWGRTSGAFSAADTPQTECRNSPAGGPAPPSTKRGRVTRRNTEADEATFDPCIRTCFSAS